jgi:hypothetical protein
MEKSMSKLAVVTRLALLALVAGGGATEAAAAAQRTFVRSDGSDTNPCSLAFPCRSFDTAIAQTLTDGEVIVLDSAGYGFATITQPVSIIAPPGIYAGVSVFAANPVGITVNAGAGKVTLRGLTINNISGTTGISYQSGTVLYIDNVVVTNFPTAGLSANLGANGSLYVANSAFRDNGTGASLAASSGTLTLSIESSVFARNTTGAVLGDGTAGSIHGSTFAGGTTGLSAAPTTAAKTSKIEVRDCTLADNSGIGVIVGSGVAAPVLVSVVSSLVSGNATGIQVTGAANAAYVSDSTITRNSTGLVYLSSGTAVSGTDNSLVNNGTNGAFSSTVPKL